MNVGQLSELHRLVVVALGIQVALRDHVWVDVTDLPPCLIAYLFSSVTSRAMWLSGRHDFVARIYSAGTSSGNRCVRKGDGFTHLRFHTLIQVVCHFGILSCTFPELPVKHDIGLGLLYP